MSKLDSSHSWFQRQESESNSEASIHLPGEAFYQEDEEDLLVLHPDMGDQPRQLTAAETVSREKLDRWKATHEKQVTEGKILPVLKGSLTRTKGFYEESFRVSEQVIEAIEDLDEHAAAKADFEDWEMNELEWQDMRDHHLKQLEKPTPQINAQLSQADKRSKFEVLLIKAQTHAESLLR